MKGLTLTVAAIRSRVAYDVCIPDALPGDDEFVNRGVHAPHRRESSMMRVQVVLDLLGIGADVFAMPGDWLSHGFGVEAEKVDRKAPDDELGRGMDWELMMCLIFEGGPILLCGRGLREEGNHELGWHGSATMQRSVAPFRQTLETRFGMYWRFRDKTWKGERGSSVNNFVYGIRMTLMCMRQARIPREFIHPVANRARAFLGDAFDIKDKFLTIPQSEELHVHQSQDSTQLLPYENSRDLKKSLRVPPQERSMWEQRSTPTMEV